MQPPEPHLNFYLKSAQLSCSGNNLLVWVHYLLLNSDEKNNGIEMTYKKRVMDAHCDCSACTFSTHLSTEDFNELILVCIICSTPDVDKTTKEQQQQKTTTELPTVR